MQGKGEAEGGNRTSWKNRMNRVRNRRRQRYKDEENGVEKEKQKEI